MTQLNQDISIEFDKKSIIFKQKLGIESIFHYIYPSSSICHSLLFLSLLSSILLSW